MGGAGSPTSPTVVAHLQRPGAAASSDAADISPEREQDWREYVPPSSFSTCSAVVAVYALQRLQGDSSMLNPQGLAAVAPGRGVQHRGEASSPTRNWQGYAGESTMSYLTQMLVLQYKNFLSAATGIACRIRTDSRPSLATAPERSATSGSTSRASRCTCCCRLSFVFALALASQGVVQNFKPYAEVALIEPVAYTEDGPPGIDGQADPRREDRNHANPADGTVRVAGGDQDARHEWRRLSERQLGASRTRTRTLGPTAADAGDLLDSGRPLPRIRTTRRRQAPGLGAARGDDGHLRRCGRSASWSPEQSGNPKIAALGADLTAKCVRRRAATWRARKRAFGHRRQRAVRGVDDGRIVRRGQRHARLVHAARRRGADAVIQLGEVVFGGVGSGLYGMLVFALLTVFIAG
jgi:K+-transporting ATPase ATPase A chain